MKRLWMVLLMVLMLLAIVAPTTYARNAQDDPSNHRPPSGVPAAPTLVSPANGAIVPLGQVTLRWNPVPGAGCYYVQGGRGPNLGAQYNIIDRTCVTGTSYTFNVTSGFVFYFPTIYWHVSARTTTGLDGVYGPWSQVWGMTFKK